MSDFIIEQSVIWPDIKDIMYSGQKEVRYEYRGLLHTEKEDIPILKIVTIDVIRDYINKIGEEIHIDFMIGFGDYIYKLYPYRNNLELTIKKILLNDTGGNVAKDSTISVERYKAIFLVNENQVVNTSNLSHIDINTLNASDTVSIKLQLIDRALEVLRIKTTHGIYKNITQRQLMSSILISESNKITIDGKPSVPGLDLVDPDNEDVKNNIVIPNGTHVINLPAFLHSKMGGVYNAGIGTFIQTFNKTKSWFVYPLFNINRYNEDTDKVIFYSLPNKKYSNLERTYNKIGKVLSILTTSNHNYYDSADADYMNSGSGFRLTDARAFMKKPIEISENGPIGKRNNLNHEVITAERNDGLNYAPVSDRGISSNPFIDRSMLSMKNVARIDLEWENSNMSLIYPGMPCKFIFLSKNKLVELKGTIVFLHNFTNLVGGTINDKIYLNKTAVSILVDKYTLQLEAGNSLSPGEF